MPPALAPVAVGAVTVAATVALAVRSPHVPGAYGLCPSLVLTGTWCPACGGLRAVHELTRLDLVAAVSLNAWVVALAPLAVLVWLAWLLRSLDVVPADGRLARVVRPLLGSRAAVALAVTLVTFWILRNLPLGAALAPT